MTSPSDIKCRRDFRQETFHLNGHPIPKSPKIRYLRMMSYQNCALILDVQQTLQKTRNWLNLLYRIRVRTAKTLIHTYNSFIRPVVEYRAPIYALLQLSLLKQISCIDIRAWTSSDYPSNSAHCH
ncbi:hypothetical protein MTP99_007857 [Tenebrio molitor]|jgi:hypothetical protein|nr:hypothetical protein MTP99_007857 [Tenebrio molitor]